MRDELIAFNLQIGHFREGFEYRETGLEALLGGRDHNLLQALYVNRLTLRMLAEQQRDLIRSHLHTFLDCPLGTVDILGRRDTDMDRPFVQGFGRLHRGYTHLTMLAMRVRDDTMIELPYSVRDENLIAGRTT